MRWADGPACYQLFRIPVRIAPELITFHQKPQAKPATLALLTLLRSHRGRKVLDPATKFLGLLLTVGIALLSRHVFGGLIDA